VQLTLNEELELDRLERAARAGNIKPAPMTKPEEVEEESEPWYTMFQLEEKEPEPGIEAKYERMSKQRRENVELLLQTLN
jgi:hypothetical protein